MGSGSDFDIELGFEFGQRSHPWIWKVKTVSVMESSSVLLQGIRIDVTVYKTIPVMRRRVQQLKYP